jgi:hypothetical protein
MINPKTPKLVVCPVLYVALCGVGLGTSPALAADGTTADGNPGGDPSQLIDTSKQIGQLQKKMADLLAQGRVARSGKLSLDADCGSAPDSSQVFGQWGDTASYALAPQGDFSETDGWTFKNSSLASDHDPFTGGGTSLVFANGGSQAVSPVMCVNLDNPTIRFFARDLGGNGKSDLKITVLYEDLNGKTQHLDLAKVRASSDWGPTIAGPIGVNFLSTASANGVTVIAFQFKAEGLQKNETLEVDNLYVDPFCSR